MTAEVCRRFILTTAFLVLAFSSIHPSIDPSIFGRPFVKRFVLWYRTRTVVCQSSPVLPVVDVTMVYCGQTVGWMNMPLGTKVASAQATLC